MSDILIVDDSEIAAQIMKGYVEQSSSHRVWTAITGVAAQSIINVRKFDVLVFDYLINDVNGLELIRWARRQGVLTPVILCSAIDEQDLSDIAKQAAGEKLGPIAVMTKGKNPPSKILDLIEKLTNKEVTALFR